MTQPAGWYDDPQDPSQLRYWDGVSWSDHLTPRVSPSVAQSNIGMPHDVIAASGRQQGPPSQGRGQGRGQGQPAGQSPAYPQATAYGQEQGWSSHPSTTPDGVALAGWWIRVGARLLDAIFTFLLALPLTGWFYYQYFAGAVDWSKTMADQAAAGAAPVMPFPPLGVLLYAMVASLIGLLVAASYEVLFLRRSGATPGKKIVGISVRLRDQAGPPPMKAVLGRTSCYYGLSLVGSSFGTLLDCLWPLWDDKKQAIHDKAAATNVVHGPQPKRDA